MKSPLAFFFVGIILSIFATQPPSTRAPLAPESEAGNGGGVWSGAYAKDDAVFLSLEKKSGSRASVASQTGEAKYRYERIVQRFCGTLDTTSTGVPCVDDAASTVIARVCEDGSTALDPLFRREVDPATGSYIGLWEPTADTGGCPEDDPDEPVVLTAADFQRLPLAPSSPQFQPADGRGLVNMELVVYTDPGPQQLTTTVLGSPVEVRATPVEYTWDFGDGSDRVITADAGAPWPDHTVGHPYLEPGAYEVQLVTTWAGEYRVAGAGPWLDVDGTAVTTSPPFTATVYEARSALVADSLP